MKFNSQVDLFMTSWTPYRNCPKTSNNLWGFGFCGSLILISNQNINQTEPDFKIQCFWRSLFSTYCYLDGIRLQLALVLLPVRLNLFLLRLFSFLDAFLFVLNFASLRVFLTLLQLLVQLASLLFDVARAQTSRDVIVARGWRQNIGRTIRWQWLVIFCCWRRKNKTMSFSICNLSKYNQKVWN